MNENEILHTLMQRQIFLALVEKNDPLNKQILKVVDDSLARDMPRYNIDLNQPAKGGKA